MKLIIGKEKLQLIIRLRQGLNGHSDRRSSSYVTRVCRFIKKIKTIRLIYKARNIMHKSFTVRSITCIWKRVWMNYPAAVHKHIKHYESNWGFFLVHMWSFVILIRLYVFFFFYIYKTAITSKNNLTTKFYEICGKRKLTF